MKPALFLASNKKNCYFLGAVGTKVQAFYVTHDNLAEVKGSAIKNKDMLDNLTEFVTTSRRATSKVTPIYPISKDNHEKAFNSINCMNIFDKLKGAQKAKGTPQYII